MIRITDQALPHPLLDDLAAYQRRVDNAANYASKVDAAKREFSALNVKGNPTFDGLKRVLDSMCSGARRCMYCEDSAADEIEHFKPKQFYPEDVFVWVNYLYVCGLCNITKRSKFAIRLKNGVIVHLTRKRDEIPVAPTDGTHVLIHPRTEDPSSFLALDLIDTFAFVPPPAASPESIERSNYTVRTLGLNRDVLVRARKEAYSSYLATLKEYSAAKSSGLEPEKVKSAMESINAMQHPAVWNEMKRWRNSIETLATLFNRNPELL